MVEKKVEQKVVAMVAWRAHKTAGQMVE